MRGSLLRAVRVLWFAAREFRRDFCFERAATLSFVTIISLMPLSVLLLGAFVQFGKGDELIQYLRERVFPNLAPSFQEQLSGWLEQNISRKAFQNSAAGIVGVLALASLLVAAMGGLVAAERIFNKLWKVEGTRSYFQKAVTFWSILTLSPFLMVASLSVEKLLVPRGGIFEQMIEGSLLLKALYGFFVPFTIGFLGLAMLYKYLPQANVRIKSALIGGLIAALLWETSKIGFKVYVAKSSAVTSLYGPLSIVPLFLVWVYLNWAIVLWGCELSYSHQNLGRLNELLEQSIRGRRIPEHYIAFCLLERTGRAFSGGGVLPECSVVAEELGVIETQVEDVARKLAEANVLIASASSPGEYALAKDPRRIQLREVVGIFQHNAVSNAFGPESATDSAKAPVASRAILEEAHSRYMEAFTEKTLADLLSLPERAHPTLRG